MTRTVYYEADGLGMPLWLAGVIGGVASTIGGALATRLISGPSKPSQRDVEAQLRLQTQLDIQRAQAQAQIQQQQTAEVGSYLVPALGVLALVMLLR